LTPGRTAVYSTVFPGIEPFLNDWYESLVSQDDKDFDLWLGVDGLSIEAIETAVGKPVRAQFVVAVSGESPASLRSRAFEQLVSRYDAIIFADADDIHCANRVSQAKTALQRLDLFGCAVELIDRDGRSLEHTLSADGDDWSDRLGARNMFGFTNSSIRVDALERILPIPADCRLVDWYIATSCLLDGGQLGFSAFVGAKYRVYESSTTRVVPPIRMADLIRGTRLVLEHFHLMSLRTGLGEDEQQWIHQQSSRVEQFRQFVEHSPARAEAYLAALNRRVGAFWWWDMIACRHLSSFWGV
jgi:hypothetical protein